MVMQHILGNSWCNDATCVAVQPALKRTTYLSATSIGVQPVFGCESYEIASGHRLQGELECNEYYSTPSTTSQFVREYNTRQSTLVMTLTISRAQVPPEPNEY